MGRGGTETKPDIKEDDKRVKGSEENRRRERRKRMIMVTY